MSFSLNHFKLQIIIYISNPSSVASLLHHQYVSVTAYSIYYYPHIDFSNRTYQTSTSIVLKFSPLSFAFIKWSYTLQELYYRTSTLNLSLTQLHSLSSLLKPSYSWAFSLPFPLQVIGTIPQNNYPSQHNHNHSQWFQFSP